MKKAKYFIFAMLLLLSVTSCNSNRTTSTYNSSGSSPSPTPSASEREQTNSSPSATTEAIDNNTTPPPADNSKLVVIDAGHGGHDPGTDSGDIFEKEINLAVALKLEAILKDSGVETYMIRTDDSFVGDPKERILSANDMGAGLYISIHCNSFDDPSVSGTTIIYNPSDELSTGNLKESEYASTIRKELMKMISTRDRNPLKNGNYVVVKYAEMPSIIVELGFVTSPVDAELLASQDFQQTAAQGLANGIIKSLDAID